MTEDVIVIPPGPFRTGLRFQDIALVHRRHHGKYYNIGAASQGNEFGLDKRFTFPDRPAPLAIVKDMWWTDYAIQALREENLGYGVY